MSDVKFTINHAALRHLDRAAARALEMTAEAIHTEVVQAQVMPFRTGVLQNSRTFVAAGTTVTESYDNGDQASTSITKAQNGVVSIINTGPQARRLYYHPEYNFYKGENPNAGGHWFDPWLSGGAHEDFPQKAFEEFFKREAGL